MRWVYAHRPFGYGRMAPRPVAYGYRHIATQSAPMPEPPRVPPGLLVALISLELYDLTKTKLYPEESKRFKEWVGESFHSMWGWVRLSAPWRSRRDSNDGR